MANTTVSEQVGQMDRLPPEPINADQTTYVSAGAVTIAVEQRHLTLDGLRQSYKGNPEHARILEEIMAPAVAEGKVVDDAGVSLHVLDSGDRYEYLRFDCFRKGPHYHYIFPVEADGTINHRSCPFDSVSNGDMLDWALERLTSHLPDMLTGVGAEHLVRQLNQAQLNDAVEEVRKEVLTRIT